MKKLLKILGGLVGVLLLIILTAPFFVNVDQFRPKIIQVANENINGSIELGKLSLSLWGKIHVAVDGLKVLDKEKNQVVAVKDASFDTSYFSIFAGSPLLTLSLNQPEITVLKSKDGKMNVMSLMKETTAAGSPGQPIAGTTTATSTPSAAKADLPAMLVNAHFGISIVNAKLIYKDQAMALSNTIDNLNVRVKDFSLTRKTELEIWADLKTQMGSDLKVEGPLKLTADLTPDVSGGEFKSASVNATFSADDLVIEKGTLFSKKKGVPANFKFSASLDQLSMKLKEAVLKFFNAEIMVSGAFDKVAGANMHFGTKPVDLKPWSELVSMLATYELEGKLSLDGDVKGKPEAIAYNAKLKIDNFSAKGPNLKAKPIINGVVEVTTDKIDRFLIQLQGPGNDLTIGGKLVSFSKPQITFDVKSPKGLDLDQWIEFPKTEAPAAAKKEEAKTEGAKSGSSAPAAANDLDAMLDPLRKNEMARAMSVDGVVSIAFIKAKGIRIDDIAAKLQLKNLIAAVTGFKMKMYDGTIGAGFTMDMKPKEPQYNFNSNVSGFDLQKAVESSMPSLKNTVIGKLNFSAQGGGASFNAEPAKRHLQMKGEFKLLNAQFKGVDIAKMANDAINGSIGKIGDKVPFLKGKNIHVSPSVDSRYDSITGHFTINNGMLDAPDFMATASAKRGIDLKGATKLGLIDESLDAKWELIDTQRVTGADQLTVNVSGKDIKNFLAKSEKDPVIIPVTVGCKWTAPCPSYTAAPEYLAGVAAGRLSHVAQDVVKSKALDAVQKAIGNQPLPGGLGNGLKKLFGN